MSNQCNAKLDRSLRGWVVVETEGRKGVYWAKEDGLYQYRGGVACITWDQAAYRRYKVTKLRILQPGEVAVKIPPVSEWDNKVTSIDILTRPHSVEGLYSAVTVRRVTREHAERMELDRPEAELEREKNR